ncbi:MAG: glycosyltransferase family 4 protein [Candidatus Omnitrophica bacterium]|nr:glycosyltransferase family 4 protein [Candidatus Omnitrophota bacterium]
MNVLMVHPHDIHHDPWTIRILALARELQKHGHTVKICHLPRRDKPKHAPLRLLRKGDPPLFFMKPRQKNVIYNYQLIRRLASDCDIIHLQKCFAAAALPVLWAGRLLGKRLHYDWDDDETAISKIVEKRRFSRWQLAVYERMMPHFADSLTYSSRAIRERALRIGFPEDRMRHLPVGADAERFSPDHRSKDILREWGLDPTKLTVLYIGQLEGAASAHLLIQAAPEVIRVQPNTQFLFVGGGEQEDALRKETENSSTSDAIFLTGYVDSSRMPEIVGAADICAACFEDNAGTRAKSPLKIAEYLASGKPIVASRVGDASWMIDGCGIAVEPGSSQALAQGILAYAADPDRRHLDGEKARQRALQHFTWGKGAERLLEAYSCASKPLVSS